MNTSSEGVSSQRAKVLGVQLSGFVELALYGRLERDGFGLNDAVAMLVVLERMSFDRGVVKLKDAYCPRERETTELITRRERMDVVTGIVVPERMLFCEGMGMLEAVYGRVSRDAVLYVVRRYFGSEHA